MTRAVAYVRLSKDTDASTSVARQREEVERYAASRGWDLVDVFEDVDVSGFKKGTKRPGRERFVASFPDVEVALFYRVDRVARSLRDFSSIMAEADAHGVALVSATESLDASTPMGRAMLQIVGIFAELESRNISARVTSSNAYLRRNGRKGGGRAPFGYRSVPNPDGPGLVLEVDPERVEVLRSMADRILSGSSLYAVAEWLREEEVPPPLGADWHPGTVETILRNPVLCGRRSHRGDLVRDDLGLPVTREDLAILSPEEFARLVAALGARKRPGTRTNRTRPGLLSRLAVCDSCGGTLHRATVATKFRQYRCQRRECEARPGVSLPSLEEYVVEEFLSRFGRLAVVVPVAEDAGVSASVADLEQALDLVRDEIRSASREERAALREREDDLLARLDEAEEEASREPAPVRFVATGETFAEAWHAIPEEDVEARRDLLSTAVQEVRLRKGTRGGNGARFVPEERVEIRWTGHGETPDYLAGQLD